MYLRRSRKQRHDDLSGHLLFGSLRHVFSFVRASGGRGGVLPDFLFCYPMFYGVTKKKMSFVRKIKLFVSYVNVLHNTVL